MIWLVWRQFRTQALVTLGLLAAFAALVVLTGLNLHHTYDSLGGAHCQTNNCYYALTDTDKPLQALLGPALLVIPALLGMFWGAPLVGRELETGTYRLVWTQSVSRRHWLLVKVALVGLAALAVAGLASWLVTWWFGPLDTVNVNRFAPSVFTARGIVAVGYAGFAFALGVASGVVVRRTLPAIVVTLLGFVAVRIGFTLWIRPHLLTAREIFVSVAAGKGVGFVSSAAGVSIAPGSPPIPNAWMVSATLVDRAHRALSTAQLHELLARTCPSVAAGVVQGAGGPGKTGDDGGYGCSVALSHHLQQLISYQPPSHYWPLQALETGIFLAAALALIGVTLWRIGRRAAHRPAVSHARERTASSLALKLTPKTGVPPARVPENEER